MEDGSPSARKVMVEANPTREPAGALQYALSHALLEQDELTLIHADNPNAWKNPFATLLRQPSNSNAFNNTTAALPSSSEGVAAKGEVDFLEEMKQACEVAQPKLRVRLAKVQLESSTKASVPLSQTTVLGIDLLIIGRRRSPPT